ncbi:MAG: hypothetical protein UW41_C0011G0019 [Candidatus Collierbacteria bacterium GW2011_GWC2_44_18]|uniref:Uncharacterized protein n=1 Tax=Candidatus Collierbacteria bacterium GW2011_GWC2_44_18 TaxID=1618392 RepID=A0A0G1JZ45_9BACT|nr:MAG: hypothetical protein UW16_C0023G0018 [Microgenomates group bacterium GW2011_GWC1_44_10]KKT49137.1 MAG: hypothetical protein UW41_C0011G0019 [Candidatus Collierbacteria bacterium GW2011_GWC2_44_18]
MIFTFRTYFLHVKISGYDRLDLFTFFFERNIQQLYGYGIRENF